MCVLFVCVDARSLPIVVNAPVFICMPACVCVCVCSCVCVCAAKPLLSVFSGTTPMRTNSAQLSVLVRGPTGQLEQQLQQQSSHSQLVPAAAAGTQHGAQGGGAGGAGRALMDGCEAPQVCVCARACVRACVPIT